MIRRNESQSKLFGYKTLLGEDKLQKLKDSEEAISRRLIFRRIPEQEFAVLYTATGGATRDYLNILISI